MYAIRQCCIQKEDRSPKEVSTLFLPGTKGKGAENESCNGNGGFNLLFDLLWVRSVKLDENDAKGSETLAAQTFNNLLFRCPGGLDRNVYGALSDAAALLQPVQLLGSHWHWIDSD